MAGDDGLLALLAEARRLGFLGPAPILDHIAHASAYLGALDELPLGRALDLGSGGGVPGLILALARPSSCWVLLDASARRTAFLERAVRSLVLGGRVQVVTGRAEEVGRRSDHRGSYQAVVARSFGRPAVVAECAAPLLAVGGHLMVSEPPQGGQNRWPDQGLSSLGLRQVASSTGDGRLALLHQERLCPERYPRRVGVPGKRPLW